MSEEDIQRRAYFRLRYPVEARLPFICEHARYSVSEISEGGMRIILKMDDEELPCPENLLGLLEIGGQTLALEGRILRRDQDEAVLVLSEGIPLPLVLSEQRRLLRQFPALFGRE